MAAGLYLPVWKIRMNDLGATVPHVLKIYGAQKMHKFWTDKYGTPGNT